MTPDSIAETNERPSWLRRHGFKVAASLLLAIGFALLMHAGALPLVPKKEAFAHVRWWTVGGYLLLFTMVHFIRAIRWGLLLQPLHPVPMRRVISVAFIGFAAIVLLPFRTGEAARPVLIRKKGHLSGWAATGTVAAERIIDGLSLSALLLVALQLSSPLSPLPDRIGDLPVSAKIVPTAAYAALTLFAVAFTVMGVFYWRREWARHTTHRVVGVISPKFADWLSERVEHVASGLTFLPRANITVPFIAATALYWGLNAAGTWFLAWGCGFPSYSYDQACVTIGVLALGILVPNAPGFFGAYQLSIYASFAMYFPLEVVVGPGAAYVFFSYLSQLFVTVVAAIAGMLVEHTSLNEALSAE